MGNRTAEARANATALMNAQKRAGIGSNSDGSNQVEVMVTQFTDKGEPTQIIADGESVGNLEAYRKIWMLLNGVRRLSDRVWRRINIKWTRPMIIGD